MLPAASANRGPLATTALGSPLRNNRGHFSDSQHTVVKAFPCGWTPADLAADMEDLEAAAEELIEALEEVEGGAALGGWHVLPLPWVRS
jgi:hypothetical protein